MPHALTRRGLVAAALMPLAAPAALMQLAVPAALMQLAVPALACSRVVWSGEGGAPVLVGRNMDWLEPMRESLWVLPRGAVRDGAVPVNPARWTARHGSVVITAYDLASADGINEAGLTANMLYLVETDFGARDVSRPGLSVSLWLQYMLDNFSSVAEAVAFVRADTIQVRPAAAGDAVQREATVHLSLADPTGDSAVIEIIGGRPRLYHDRAFTVMTNSPPYDQQIASVQAFRAAGGGEASLPGSVNANARLLRGVHYSDALPRRPADQRAAVAGVLSVMRNLAQPMGTPDPGRPNISQTIWRSVADLTDRMYFYESSFSPNIIWVRLAGLDFSRSQKLDLVGNHDRVGDQTGQFAPTPPFAFLPSDR